jgi:1-acyl-sn-glycerol-3-phosphate acyltransferase
MESILPLAATISLLGFLILMTRWAIKTCEKANVVDWGGPWLNRLDGLNRLFCKHYHRLQHNSILLPEQGGALLASNHVSGLDPLLLIAAARRPLRFMIAREQYNRFGFTWLFKAIGCIPVERDRRPEQALREALRVLQAGEVVAMFPHGRIHLDSDPPRPLKRGILKLAQIAQCSIYPVRVEGVRGEGQVVSAVLMRSHAHLASYPPLPYTDADGLERLGPLLEGR